MKVFLVLYGFADASKSGFGASLETEQGIRYSIDTWGKDDDCESSNFREFENVVSTLELEVQAGRLSNSTILLATDNSTVESVLYKGNSTSEKLFDPVVRFRMIEIKSGSKFMVTHVSGIRMMAQGTDGLSRGQMHEGISLGDAMEHFCPWGKSALDRSPKLHN